MMQNLLLFCGEIDRCHFFRLPRRASIMLMPSCDAQCKRSVVAGRQIFCNVSCKEAKYLANAANALLFTISQKLNILLDAILSGHLAALQAFPRFLLKFREGEGSKKRDCGGGHELVQ